MNEKTDGVEMAVGYDLSRKTGKKGLFFNPKMY